MCGHIVRVTLVAFEVKKEIVDKDLLISAAGREKQKSATKKSTISALHNSLSIGKDNRHRIRVTSQQIGRHNQSQIGRGHFCDGLDLVFQEQLQEADNEK